MHSKILILPFLAFTLTLETIAALVLVEPDNLLRNAAIANHCECKHQKICTFCPENSGFKVENAG